MVPYVSGYWVVTKHRYLSSCWISWTNRKWDSECVRGPDVTQMCCLFEASAENRISSLLLIGSDMSWSDRVSTSCCEKWDEHCVFKLTIIHQPAPVRDKATTYWRDLTREDASSPREGDRLSSWCCCHGNKEHLHLSSTCFDDVL